jgi:hypothetical protein
LLGPAAHCFGADVKIFSEHSVVFLEEAKDFRVDVLSLELADVLHLAVRCAALHVRAPQTDALLLLDCIHLVVARSERLLVLVENAVLWWSHHVGLLLLLVIAMSILVSHLLSHFSLPLEFSLLSQLLPPGFLLSLTLKQRSLLCLLIK